MAATPSQKVDSGVDLLSCLPLIHLYFKLYQFGGLGIDATANFVLISEHQIGHFHEIQNVLTSVKSNTFMSG